VVFFHHEKRKEFFLGVTATPPVFPAFLSPIVADSNRLRLIRTDLNLFGEKKNRKGQGCLGGYKKPHSSCFQFAFNLLSTVQIAREIVRYKENSFTLKQCKRTKN
jgi:hypothetical protein